MIVLREENQRLTAELQKYMAVESLSKEDPREQVEPANGSEQMD